MNYLFLKARLELIRALKPFFPKAAYVARLEESSRALRRYWARPTQTIDLQGFFAPAPEMQTVQRPIDILIPVYNGIDIVPPCLDSLLKNTDLPFHIYMADDASPDERLWPLLQKYQAAHPDKITVVKNEQNSGIIKTLNRLISMTQNDFLVLNTDTELPPHWASRLFAPIFADERLAAVGPWSNAADKQTIYFGYEERPLPIPLQTADKQAQAFAPRVVDTVPVLVSFCMAVSRKAANKIGLLDEAYGCGYYDETDWLFRAKKAGYSFALVPNVFVYHKGTASFPSKQRRMLMGRNAKIFESRHPGAIKKMRRGRYDPQLQAAHFLMLAKCLRAQYKGLCLLPAPQATQVAFTWTREGDGHRYELTEESAYEVLYSPLPPEQLDALTRPN